MRAPLRTCIGCRARRPQAELLRLRRAPDGRLAPAAEVAGGRSVYVCPQRACFDRAVRGPEIGRQLGPCAVEATTLWSALAVGEVGA
jgi:hypothetical protein